MASSANNQCPDLPQCIDSIKLLSSGFEQYAVKQQVELYTNAIAFLCHLKGETTILRVPSTISQDELITKTPAIWSIVNNQPLLRSLIVMLSGRDTTPENGHGQNRVISDQTRNNNNERKRSSSLECDPSSTSKKLKMHNFGAKISSSAAPVSSFGFDQKAKNSGSSKAQQGIAASFNVKVFAAVVLHTAFQYVDNWPAEFIKSFAEDSFGARAWVDNKNCAAFVNNLILLLDEETFGDGFNEAVNTEILSAAVRSDCPSMGQSVKSPVGTISSATKQAANANHQVKSTTRAHAAASGSSRVNNYLDQSTQDSESSDSSDSGEEEVIEEMSSTVSTLRATKGINTNSTQQNGVKDSSDSSDEDGAEVVEEESGFSGPPLPVSAKPPNPLASNCLISSSQTVLPTSSLSKNHKQICYFRLKSAPTRLRFFGENRDFCLQFVEEALTERLQSRTKQSNTSMLSCLPRFVKAVPRIRIIISQYLEKWLQSPALADLSRALFSALVSGIKEVDPPLEEDLEVIDNILLMKLKSNQLNVHIARITDISRRMPIFSVSEYMFIHLFREELKDINDQPLLSKGHISDKHRMFAAIYAMLPSDIGAKAFASAVLSFVASRSEKPYHMSQLLDLFQRLAFTLGSSYDGVGFVRFIVESFSNSSLSLARSDLDRVARILFEGTILMVPSQKEATPHRGQRWTGNIGNGAAVSLNDESSVSDSLSQVRKYVLKWCVTTYASAFLDSIKKETNMLSKTSINKKKNGKRRKTQVENSSSAPVGAGPRDFSTVLDVNTKIEDSEKNSSIKHIRTTIDCLLFLTDDPSSIKAFAMSSDKEGAGSSVPQSDFFLKEQLRRINVCYSCGIVLDDDIIDILLSSAELFSWGDHANATLSLIEALFLKFGRTKDSRLELQDVNFVWKLYDLSIFEPETSKLAINAAKFVERKISLDKDIDKSQSVKRRMVEASDSAREAVRSLSDPITNKYDDVTPLLAYPGSWWRVTSLVLIMCAKSADLGRTMWNEHPTIRAVITMITSGRYRFPTVDCNDKERDAMKGNEAELRDQESKIAAKLFLPKSLETKVLKQNRTNGDTASTRRGVRLSARQREKQAKSIAKQREKEADNARQEAERMKRLLGAAQKSIMIFDPRCPARKPPKEAVSIILSIENMFNLADSFRRCSSPDFLMQTIGCTTRESVERAYDWLLPIISSHPSAINRLPSSASCFLLLRAYESAQIDNRHVTLKELASPLLKHVSDCLRGSFGEMEAVLAADLLLKEICSKMSDRRRCARRVLEEAIGAEVSSNDTSPYLFACKWNCGWLFSLLGTKYIVSLISRCVQFVSSALIHERGGVLRSYIIALHKYISFAGDHKVNVKHSFVETICDLLSRRPQIYSAAMERFDDFRSLTLQAINREFQSRFEQEQTECEGSDLSATSVFFQSASGEEEAFLSVALLQAGVALMSYWKEPNGVVSGDDEIREPSNEIIRSLALWFIGEGSENGDRGVAGATFKRSGKKAIDEDQWVMMAKSRCPYIGKQSALSVPTQFLPRLLLCSGLPHTSFTTMMKRLDKLNDENSSLKDISAVYKKILSTSMSVVRASHLINHRAMAKKLHGRISAYCRIHNIDASYAFSNWLGEIISDNEKKSKRKRTIEKQQQEMNAVSIEEVNDLFQKVPCNITAQEHVEFDENWADEHKELSSLPPVSQREKKSKENLSDLLECIDKGIINGDDRNVHLGLAGIFATSADHSATADRGLNEKQQNELIAQNAIKLLRNANLAMQKGLGVDFCTVLIKVVPVWTQVCGSPTLWKLIFSPPDISLPSCNTMIPTKNYLICRCVQIWSKQHLRQSQEWLLSHHDGILRQGLSPEYVISYLVQTTHEIFATYTTSDITKNTFICMESQEYASATVSIILEQAHINSADQESQIVEKEQKSFPEWLVLLFRLAEGGKSCCRLIAKRLLDHDKIEVCASTLLRLYALHPYEMPLSEALLREKLLNLTSSYAHVWVEWQCPLDEQIRSLLQQLAKTPHQRLLQALTDISKQHPLIVARNFSLITQLLEDDAVAIVRQPAEKRGRLHANTNLFASCNVDQSSVKVKVKHWGYSFTEMVWISFLDVLAALPKEVLFHSCGLKMGTLKVIEQYLKLIYVQTLLVHEKHVSKLKTRCTSLLDTMSKSNEAGWYDWLKTTIVGVENWGTIEEVAEECDVI